MPPKGSQLQLTRIGRGIRSFDGVEDGLVSRCFEYATSTAVVCLLVPMIVSCSIMRSLRSTF